MHLLIDATCLGKRLKGVGRYSDEVLRRLPSYLPEGWRVTVVVFDRELPAGLEGVGPFNWVRISQCGESWFGLIVLKRLIRDLQANALLRLADASGHHYAVPAVTVCHDIDQLIFQAAKIRLNPLRRIVLMLRQWAKARGLRASTSVLCVSDFIRSRMFSGYGVELDRCVTHYLGLDASMTSISSSSGANTGAYPDSGYLFAIATGDPREQASMLPGLFQAIRSHGYQGALVIAGLDMSAPYASALKDSLLSQGFQTGVDFYLLGFFDASRYGELLQHFAQADAYLETSGHEGFGMQQLEALALGTLVASTGAGALREIGSDFPVYFDAEKLDDAGLRITSAIRDRDPNRIAQQIEYARSFNWDQTTQAIAQVLLDCELSESD